MTFRIQPHMRLHEWVADEAGFFRDEGLDYEFEADGFAAGTASGEMVTPAGEHLRDLADVRRFGPGERIVPQPYTGDMYVRTYRWMRDWNLVDPAQDRARYDEAVLA